MPCDRPDRIATCPQISAPTVADVYIFRHASISVGAGEAQFDFQLEEIVLNAFWVLQGIAEIGAVLRRLLQRADDVYSVLVYRMQHSLY